MKTFTKTNVLLLLLLVVAIGYIFARNDTVIEYRESVTVRDSIVRDTVIEIIPSPKEIVYKEHKDTLWLKDTVYMPVYFSQLEYKTDRYKLVIEGFRPKLVSLELYPITHFITTEKVVERIIPPPRVTHGINAGVGLLYGTKGFDMGFYVGYGVTIKLNK